MTPELKADDNTDEKRTSDPRFSPDDLTDSRKIGDWKTRYPDKVAQLQIRKESIYLISLLLFCIVMLFLIICHVFQHPFGFSDLQAQSFNQYFGIFLAGVTGGVLFDLKWLIHSVAKGQWNQDRSLWRYFIPLTSGALSVFVLLIISSGLFGLFNTASAENIPLALSLAFLSGYFSDYMAGRLHEVFDNIFGHSTPTNK